MAVSKAPFVCGASEEQLDMLPSVQWLGFIDIMSCWLSSQWKRKIWFLRICYKERLASIWLYIDQAQPITND